MIPFVTSRWDRDSAESLWSAVGNARARCGVYARKHITKSDFLPRSFPLSSAHGIAAITFFNVGMSWATLGLLAPDPARGLSPLDPLLLPRLGRGTAFLLQTKTLPGRIYAGQGRRFAVSPARNARQESSRHHGGVDSGRAERGSYWMQAQPAQCSATESIWAASSAWPI